jgi:hypothetical protein
MSSHTIFHRARRPAALAATAALLGTSMAYAAGVVGSPAAAPRTAASAGIELVSDDAGTPLFQVAGMRVGDAASSCIAVTNRSEVPVDVALHTRTTGDLDRFLRLDVERGTAGSRPSRSCDGFTAEATVFTGSLAEFPSADAPGVADGALEAGGTRVYRYTATLQGDDAVQGRSAGVAFVFSGTGEPKPEPKPEPAPAPAPAPAPKPAPQPLDGVPVPLETRPGESCTTYYLADGFNRSVNVARRVKAQLTVTQSGRGTRSERLRVSVALKTATGKTLINKGWANVTFKRNGKVVGRTSKRPFNVLMKPSAFRTGPNRVQVLIKNRHGKSTQATFGLDFGKALLREQTVCVIRGQAATSR